MTMTRSPAIVRLSGSSAPILCMVDGRGELVWANEAMARACGRPVDALVGLTVGELVHRDDADAVASARRTLAAGSEVSGLVVRARRPDGSWRSLEWTARLHADSGLVYAAARDVTDDRQTDDHRRDDEDRLRAILEYSPSSIFVKDLQGRYLIVNRQWSRVTGVPVEDALGATARESWPAEAPAIAEQERLLLETGTPLVCDERMHTKAGARDFRVSRFLMFDDDGSPYAMGGIATDINERTEAERKLAGRERLLTTVLQASPDIITLLDRDGTVQHVSAANRAVLGRHDGDLAELDLLARVHPDDVQQVAASFARMATGSVPTVQTRYRVHHSDGHWVTLDSRGQAIYDDDGQFAGAVVVSRDMTARLVSEQRLHAARESAENASRTKSQFLARMSHELRTPLNSILGFSQLLQMDDLPAEQSESVDHILRAGRHLLDLIDEVLDIARIESGHLDLMMTGVPVVDVVGDAVELTRPMADLADVSVRIVIDPGSPELISADRQRLLQVLLNLLSNAVKYNHAGGRVDVSCHAGGPGRVRLVVSDTGCGIGPDDVYRVFVPFDRLGAEDSGVEGTGVGLALSQHLVQRMGGRIGFESVPRVGSSFFIELDTATETPPAHRAVGAVDWPDGGGPVADGKPFRVLLMEDDLANVDLVERVLARRPGVELLAAMHGGLGIELARQHLPDLILVDLHLPDMPGTTVLDRLSEDSRTAAIPVAAVGSDAAAHEVRRLLGRGVVGFLTKPFDVHALLALVDAVRSARVS
jgi:PAS domain S-box-containing protein